jgi:hypothetical protein
VVEVDAGSEVETVVLGDVVVCDESTTPATAPRRTTMAAMGITNPGRAAERFGGVELSKLVPSAG